MTEDDSKPGTFSLALTAPQVNDGDDKGDASSSTSGEVTTISRSLELDKAVVLWTSPGAASPSN